VKHAGRHIYKGRGTVASDTVGWDEYELGGNSSNGTTARDGDYLLLDTQAIRTCSASMVSSKVRQRESKPFRPTRHRLVSAAR